MSDRLRIVEFETTGELPNVLYDLNDGSTFALVRDTFRVIEGQRSQAFSVSGVGYEGDLLAKESHGNATLEAEWYVSGASMDAAISALESVCALLEGNVAGRYIERRIEGATQSIFYPLRSTQTLESMYKWVEAAQTRTLHVKLAVGVAPLAEGLPMHIVDYFDKSTVADWGSPTDVTITSDELRSSANHSTAKTAINQRGYAYGDNAQWVAARMGHANGELGVYLAYADADNFIRVHTAGGNVIITLRVGGSSTTQSVGYTETGDELAVWGALIDREIYYAVSSNSASLPSYSAIHTLPAGTKSTVAPTDAELAAVGTDVGIHWKDGGTGLGGVTEYVCNPFVVPIGRAQCELYHSFRGVLPGTAPARLGARIVGDAGKFGLFSWGPRPREYNWLWNGDLSYTTTLAGGWSVATEAGVHTVAGTSVTAVSGGSLPSVGAYKGGYVGKAAITDTAASGLHFTIYGDFKRGHTYTFKAALYAETTLPITMKLGASGDIATESLGDIDALGSDWIEYDVEWTPADNQTVAHAAFVRTSGGSGGDDFLYFDACRVYETALGDLTIRTQVDGKGAFPAIGILPAGNAHVLTNFAVGTVSGSKYAKAAATSSDSSGSLSLMIDPSQLEPTDPYRSEVQVEYWARIKQDADATNVTLTLSARPAEFTSVVDRPIYTAEFGSVGVPLPDVTADAWRWVRLGTLSLPVGSRAGRLALTLDGAWTGSADNVVDYFLGVIPGARASSPTHLPDDEQYPAFLLSTAPNKYIDPDGRGFVSSGGFLQADAGLGGALPRLEPGRAPTVFLKPFDYIPHDPAESANSEASDESVLGWSLLVWPQYRLFGAE